MKRRFLIFIIKMFTKANVSIGIVVGLIVVGFLVVVTHTVPKAVSVGSVVRSNEYQSTTTDSGWANIPRIIASSTNGTMNISSIGTISCGTPSSTIIEFKDATSSTDIASTTIYVLGQGPATSSQATLDVSILRGLAVNTQTGFAGRCTITYRQ